MDGLGRGAGSGGLGCGGWPALPTDGDAGHAAAMVVVFAMLRKRAVILATRLDRDSRKSEVLGGAFTICALIMLPLGMWNELPWAVAPTNTRLFLCLVTSPFKQLKNVLCILNPQLEEPLGIIIVTQLRLFLLS